MNQCVAPILLMTAATLTAAPDSVLGVELPNEAITPVTEQCVTGAIRSANEQGMSAVVLVLDTPGGLVDSTREMVKVTLQSPVPVVAYVAPAGALAASAGTFITMAAHVAAMAPGTISGAVMKRAMARQAESERERRAKVIHAESERQAAMNLRDAAITLEGHPLAMQIRFQTLSDVGSENNTTIVFPLPIDLFEMFTSAGRKRPPQPPELDKEGALASA